MATPEILRQSRRAGGRALHLAPSAAAWLLSLLIASFLLTFASPSAAALDPNLAEGASFMGDHYDSAKVIVGYYGAAGSRLVGWSDGHRRGLEEFSRKDYPAVLRRFLPLADKGDPHASAFAGLMHYQGLGVKANTEKAYLYAMRSSEQGIPVAQLLLGDMICIGYGTGRTSAENAKAAAELYKAAANQGLAPAQAKLATSYFEGRGVQQNPKEAYRWALKAAEQGDASAQTLLGELFYFGQGVPRSHALALEWYSRAADQSILACFMLGFMHQAGEGTAKDPGRAAEWYRRAARESPYVHPPSAVNLGVLYEQGLGVAKDPAEAARWYAKAAELNYEAAAAWYGSEAEQAVAEAQVRLSLLYWNGSGVPRDYARSAELATQAAEYGSADGQWVIGVLHLNGDGVPRDPDKAAAWFRLAADQGHEAAAAKLKSLEQAGGDTR